MALREMFQQAVAAIYHQIETAGPAAYAMSVETAWEVRSIAGSRHFHEKFVPRADARHFVQREWSQLSSLAAVAAFNSALAEAVLATPQRAGGFFDADTDNQTKRERLLDLLQNTFANLTYAAGPSRPDAATIERFWQGLNEWLFGETILTIESAFIGNFTSEVATLDLGEGLRVSKVTDDDLSDWVSEGRRRWGVEAIHNVDWRIVWEYTATREEYLHGSKLPSRVDALRLALRLLKPGGLWLRFWQHRSKHPVVFYGGTRGRDEAPRPRRGNPFRLLAADEPELRRLLGAILRSNFTFYSPAKRFEDSYHEVRTSEQLADLVITLEGLFAPEKADAIAYRLAMRAAKLLETEKPKREPLFRLFKDVYGLRSKLLHGGELEHDREAQKTIRKHAVDLWELVKRVEELTRRALRERLYAPERFTHESLDRMLLE